MSFQKFSIDNGVEEVYIEILNQNNLDSSTSGQIKSISSLSEYFKWAFSEETKHLAKQLKCSSCSKDFLTVKALYRHTHTVHKNTALSPLECFICQHLFVSCEEFHDHLLTEHHIQNPEMICFICLIRLNDEKDFNEHMSCHQARHMCKQCSAFFLTERQLGLHQQYHNCTNSEVFCEICGISFQSKFLEAIHSLQHKQLDCPFQSNDTCETYSAEIQLIDHLKENHSEKERSEYLKAIEDYDQQERHAEELISGLSFKTRTKFGHGRQEVGVDRWFSRLRQKLKTECTSCSCKLTSILQLWIHFLEKHSGSKTCPVCDKQFKTTNSAILHLGSKTCKKNQDNCSQFICSQCGETFQQNEDLLYHQLTHVEPLQCSECKATFQKKLDFDWHMVKHNLRPNRVKAVFTCTVCSSQWPSMASLRKHLRSHSTSRPFQCEFCGMTFKRQQALAVHLRTVHSEVTHACTQCDATFGSTDALSRHVARVHVRLRRFVCGLCAKRWPQNQDLRRHLSRAHSVDVPPLNKAIAPWNVEVHVIPPMTNLKSDDPLRAKIEQVIKEEKAKLRSLQTSQTAEHSGTQDKNDEDVAESLPQESAASTTQAPSHKPNQGYEIFLSCDSCNFRCQDIKSWIEHTAQHQQLVTNSQVSCPVNLISVPVVPVQAFLIPPVLPTLSYVTNFVPAPATDVYQQMNVADCVTSSVNACPFPVNILDNTFLTNQENIPREDASSNTVKIEESPPLENVLTEMCETDQVIDINGMIVRITRANETDSQGLSENAEAENGSLRGETPEEIISGEAFAKVSEIYGSASIPVLPSDVGNLAEGVSGDIDKVIQLVNDENQGSRSQIQPMGMSEVLDKLPQTGKEREKHEGVFDGVTSTSTLKEPHFEKSSKESCRWECNQCGKVLSSSKNLVRHSKAHSGEKPYTCPTCGKAFLAKHNLKIHSLTHTEERPYSCSVCDKKMRYRKEYVEHKKQHEGTKEYYICSECGQSFTRQRDLVRHQSLHSVEKRYECPVCSKSFNRLDYLKQVHIPRRHGQFRCMICKKRFQMEEDLKEHQRNHPKSKSKEDQKRFMCPSCGKTFASNRSLKTHLNIHKNRKAYVVCYSCPRKFKSVTAMVSDKRRLKRRKNDVGNVCA